LTAEWGRKKERIKFSVRRGAHQIMSKEDSVLEEEKKSLSLGKKESSSSCKKKRIGMFILRQNKPGKRGERKTLGGSLGKRMRRMRQEKRVEAQNGGLFG